MLPKLEKMLKYSVQAQIEMDADLEQIINCVQNQDKTQPMHMRGRELLQVIARCKQIKIKV